MRTSGAPNKESEYLVSSKLATDADDAQPPPKAAGRYSVLLFLVMLVIIAAGPLGVYIWRRYKPTAVSPVTQMMQEAEIVNERPWCDLILQSDDFKQLICIDNNGKYMPGVHQANVFFDVNGELPVVRLYRWTGVYKPTNPQVEDWRVRKVQVLSAQEFQAFVDQEYPASKLD